jgi:peptidyl-prolyl cis-trans isomerase C
MYRQVASAQAALSCLAGLLLGACSGGVVGEPARVPRLATLGERGIDVDRFFLDARSRTAPGEFPRSGSGFESFRDRLLRDIVIDELLLIEAVERGIKVSAEEVEALVSESAAAVDDPETEGLEFRLLEERYGTPEAYRLVLRRRLLVTRAETAVREQLDRDVEIAPQQLDEALARHAETLVQAERIRARQIFIPEQAMARRLHARLVGGADFETVARKQNGGNGDMGWMDVDSAPPLLVQVSEGMAEGEISDLHHSSLGYHIFQFLGRRPAKPLAPEQARAEIEKLLRGEATESRFRLWLAARTDVLGLSVDEKAVAKLQCCHLGLPYFGKPGQEDER